MAFYFAALPRISGGYLFCQRFPKLDANFDTMGIMIGVQFFIL